MDIINERPPTALNSQTSGNHDLRLDPDGQSAGSPSFVAFFLLLLLVLTALAIFGYLVF